MELRNLTEDDLALYEAIHCDPAMMEHLGGPLPREGLADKLTRDVAATEADDYWVLVILPEDDDRPAGTVSVWRQRDTATRSRRSAGWSCRSSRGGGSARRRSGR